MAVQISPFKNVNLYHEIKYLLHSLLKIDGIHGSGCFYCPDFLKKREPFY